ncbi:MAG: RagB/SusD family nutrient uptake outer membrane protein [Gemmatimonadaceae bacterium]
MKNKYLAWLAAAALLAGCDSPLEVDPTASIDSETALATPRGIELGLNGAYRSLQSGSLYGLEDMVFPDLYADNLDFSGTFQTHREVGLRNLSTSNGAVLGIWQAAYVGINRTNNLLEAIDNVTALTAAQRSQYRGEALFIRALNYAILTRYFSDVPLVTTASRGVGPQSLVSRTPRADVYTQIQTDLEEAAMLLPAGRVQGRATQDAANALLARVYLEDGEYALARDKATLLINNTTYSLPATFRDIFTVKNSSESIFELQFSVNNANSQSFWFYPQALGGRWGFTPSVNLLNAFEAGDERRDASILTAGAGNCPVAPCRYGNKYFRIANGDDNVIALRLAEMYLIRAEANAQLNAPAATVRADIDVVRNRAGLANLAVTVTSQTDLLTAVLQERRVEFAFEGHRFFDLRRLGRAETVLTLAPERLLWPIPQAERDVNANLTQNNGY